MKRFVLGLATWVLLLGGVANGRAAQLIVNGGFETGTFAGWTVVDQPGGSGSWFIQTGTLSPTSGFTVPPPPQGTFAAMTDQGSPGSHVLFQDFVVPLGVGNASLSFQRFIGNRAGDFSSPNTLDFGTSPNQQARVDIITTTANPFSVAAGDVLANVFQTQPGDPLVSGYTLQNTDLTALLAAHQGETLRLRFAEVDNELFFQFGVDAVSLGVTPSQVSGVPEPASLTLVGIGLIGIAGSSWRRWRNKVVAIA
jgi:hypothetical protein